MRVLFVLTQLRHGGAQAQAIDVARGLSDSGAATFTLVALRQGTPHLHDLDVRTTVLSSYDGDLGLPLATLRLWHICRCETPDIVHSHGDKAYIVARVVCASLSIPHVTTLHTPRPWHWRPRLGRFLERSTSCLTRRHIAVSEEIASVLTNHLGIPPARVEIIPNWAPPERGLGASGAALPRRGAPTLLNVARLDQAKGHEVLLNGFALVRRSHPGAILWVAGSGERLASLQRLAGDGVLFLGERTDIPHLMRTADLFVMSSHWEGEPLALLEAMRERLPIVATGVGGIPNILQHGRLGLLVPPADAHALASTILAHLSDPAAARARANEAALLTTSRREEGLRRYLQCYDTLLRGDDG